MDDRYESLVNVGLGTWFFNLVSTLTGANALTKVEAARQSELAEAFDQLLFQMTTNLSHRMALHMVSAEASIQFLGACYAEENNPPTEALVSKLVSLSTALFTLMDQQSPSEYRTLYDFLKKVYELARKTPKFKNKIVTFDNWQFEMEAAVHAAFARYGITQQWPQTSCSLGKSVVGIYQPSVTMKELHLLLDYSRSNNAFSQKFFEAYRLAQQQKELIFREIVQQTVLSAIHHGPEVLSLFFSRYRHYFSVDGYFVGRYFREPSSTIKFHSETMLTWTIQQPMSPAKLKKILMVFEIEGVNFNQINNLTHRDTGLHLAVLGRKFELIPYLMQYGADTCLKNAAGDTPLTLLIQNTEDCFECIRQNPALESQLYEAFACLINPNTVHEVNILRVSPMIHPWVVDKTLCLQFICYSLGHIQPLLNELLVTQHLDQEQYSNKIPLHWFKKILTLFDQAGATLNVLGSDEPFNWEALCLSQGLSTREAALWQAFLSQFRFYASSICKPQF